MITKRFHRLEITGDYFKITEKVILNGVPLIQEYDVDKLECSETKDQSRVKQLDISIKLKNTVRFY